MGGPTAPAPSPKRSRSKTSVTTDTSARRPPALQSASAPKLKKAKLVHRPEGSKEVPIAEKGQLVTGISQGSSSDLSATKWFDQQNENVEPARDDSPFYLANQASYPGGPRRLPVDVDHFGRLSHGASENEDLRGVIDDLTIENKRLKKLLKTAQSRPNTGSEGADKLFEVRMHGLPADKKRELEEILKTFATSANNSVLSKPSSLSTQQRSSENASSHPTRETKLSNPTDSGYASITPSGMTSTAHLNDPSGKSSTRSNRDNQIKNYLHDIPDSLVPRSQPTLTDSAKMKLVVQRLEQLFTGKTAKPGEHSQPLQQQKISKSAARADRREDQRQNRIVKEEGSREAQILAYDSGVNLDGMDNDAQPNTFVKVQDSEKVTGVNYSPESSESDKQEDSPAQRPTRPLDLDIHRAQVAADNIEYIRHLGLLSPQFGEGTAGNEQPWMFLNLLSSMAQVHTLNVTPAFIRKAIKQYSSRFELSKDGHKIRWMGGRNATFEPAIEDEFVQSAQRFSEDSAEDPGQHSARSTSNGQSMSHQGNSLSLSDSKLTRDQTSLTGSRLPQSNSKSSHPVSGDPSTKAKTSLLDYKPLVFKGKKKYQPPSYLDSTSSHGSLSPESNELVHALSRSNLGAATTSREGLITFFSNSNFVSDLSCDKSSLSVPPVAYPADEPFLGMSQRTPWDRESVRHRDSAYFTTRLPEVSLLSSEDDTHLEMSLEKISHSGEEESQPMELPASGIGGVRPEDNFALDVQVERQKIAVDGAAFEGRRRSTGKRAPGRYKYRPLKCNRLDLRPSILPPPSYIFFGASSSSGAAQTGYSTDASASDSESNESPAPAGFLWQWSSSSNERLPGEEDSNDTMSDANVEATLPSVMHAPMMSREHFGMRQPDRAISGSVAATVGASMSVASVLGDDIQQEREQDEGFDEAESVSSMDVDGSSD